MDNNKISLHPGGLALTHAAAKAANMKPGDLVLDVGCGTGTSLAHLAAEFGIIPSGIDLSETTVRKACTLHPDLDIRTANAENLPFRTGSFNHVLIECVLPLLDDREAALGEAVRVLRPGGHLIIGTLTGPGTVDPGQLDLFLRGRGLTCVYKEDRTGDLTQYMIDTIMEYGSLEERIRAEQELTGASVFDCRTGLDAKKTGYHSFVYKAGSGTPVDRLVAERIGVTPEDLTQEAVEKYQMEALKRTVKYAKEKSVFYRSHLAGIDPDQLEDMESVRCIPTTSELDLAGNERLFQCLSQSMVDRIVTVPVIDSYGSLGNSVSICLDKSSGNSVPIYSDNTSGNPMPAPSDKSSVNLPENTPSASASPEGERVVTLPTSGTGGRRKRISYTANDQERSVEFINRGFLTMDCREGERMLIFMSGTAPGSIGDLVARAMAPLHMEIKVYGAVTNIADAYKELIEFRPAVVEALPWHAAALARYGTRFGNPEKEFIRSVNLSADVVPDSVVLRLENLWGCSVHRHYGTTEMAIFGGVECICHKGYHTRPCDILYEIPETDPDGYGELLITTLDREAMPFIRYRTGDIARFTDEPCPCGCRIRRIEKFKGRKTSLVRLPQSSFYLSELADALYSIPETVDFDLVLNEGKLIVRTLPGESIRDEMLAEVVHRFADNEVDGGVDSGGESVPGLCIYTEETMSFPSGYNIKKKIL